MIKKNERQQIPVCAPPNLFKMLYYDISKTSVKKILDEAGKEIKGSATALSRVYHFTAVVQDTNRPAFSQYVCIVRPQGYVYAEKIVELSNPGNIQDINAPVFKFDADKTLVISLKETSDLHRVWVFGEKLI